MANKDVALLLTDSDLAATFADAATAAQFPPIFTVDQAAALLQIPKQTIYDWSSRGRLGSCSRKVGKHLRIYRDKLLLLVFNRGVNHDES